MGSHIGLAKVKVVMLDRSPFSGQQKQEVAHYFNAATFEGMQERRNVDAVPDPLHGIRISEVFNAYPNFLTDPEGTYLEDAYTSYEEPSPGENVGTTATATGGAAAGGATPKTKPTTAVPEAKARAASFAGMDELQKTFFTWQIGQNLFEISKDNPAPVPFGKPITNNAPEWTYVNRARPGGDEHDIIQTPWMCASPRDSASTIHWGAVTSGPGNNGGVAMNQSFQIIYYHDARDPMVAKDAKVLKPRIRFVDPSGREIDMRLTNAVYLAVEFGIGTNDHYMAVFRNDLEPHFFKVSVQGSGKTAILVEKLMGFNSSRLFDSNHKYFTVEFESAVGSLIIRNSVSTIPWVINAPISNPIFIGGGPVKLFGGNVQAGFAIRPIQYHKSGSFLTPEAVFNFVSKGGGAGVRCTTALKGSGSLEQIRDYDEGGNAVVHMVDAEKVNGESLNTILQYGAQRATEGRGLSREVSVELKEVEVKDRASIGELTITTKSYSNLITLKSGDMVQPNGYVVQNGRSPYIFMVRCEVPATVGQEPVEVKDVSCDVMGIDLNWNATSYNEFKHTGTIRFLNYRNGMANHTQTDYRSYTNRSFYLRIYAGWEKGVGDPIADPIFTGQTLSAEVSTKAEREIVTFQIEDYMAALQGSKFSLSPWYDSMSSSFAIRDIVLSTGFSDKDILTDGTQIAMANLADDFVLPYANPFEEPVFRMKDGSSFLEGILSIAKLNFKAVYFDSRGRFHLDTMPGGLFNNKNYTVKNKFWSKWEAGGAAKPADQAFNLTSYTRLINDVWNVIQVFSVDKRSLARLSGAAAYKAGIYDPKAEGYLGYRKHFMLAEPALGSYDAMMNYLDEYRRRLFIPPLTARFEAYGRATMTPLDIVHLDGTPLRIMSIQTHIDRQENTFYQNIEGEWFFSAGSGKDQAPQLTDVNTGPDAAGSESPGARSGY